MHLRVTVFRAADRARQQAFQPLVLRGCLEFHILPNSSSSVNPAVCEKPHITSLVCPTGFPRCPTSEWLGQMRHDGVPVENMEDEQMKWGVEIEPAIPPRVVQFPARLLHRGPIQEPHPVFPNLPEGGCNRDVPWPPFKLSFADNITSGGSAGRRFHNWLE